MRKLARYPIVTAWAIAIATLAPSAFAGPLPRPFALMPGDSAPKLAIGKWVKGEPIEHFEASKTYLIEFWGAWTKDSLPAIPQLTEIQKKYKDLECIAVSVGTDDESAVSSFVDSMGTAIDYRVAIDQSGSDDGTAGDGVMKKTWLDASGVSQFPVCFVVKDLKVICITTPSSVSEPIGEIVSGKWDAKSFAKEYAEERAVEVKMAPIQKKLAKAFQSENWVAFNTGMQEALEGPAHDSAGLLNDLVWACVQPNSPIKKSNMSLLKRMIDRSLLLDGKNWHSIDTLARLYFVMGNQAKAAQTEKRALELAPEGSKAEIKKTLFDYESVSG